MMRPEDILTGVVIGGALVWFWPRKVKAQPKATPSCGCILCDLKVPRQNSHLGHFHQTQHGIAACHRVNR